MLDQDLQVIDRMLLIRNTPVDLKHDVADAVLFDETIIYLLIGAGNRNIGAITMDGEHLWKIQEVESGLEHKSFKRIWIDDMHRVLTYNYLGITYIIDADNGRITPHKYYKWSKHAQWLVTIEYNKSLVRDALTPFARPTAQPLVAIESMDRFRKFEYWARNTYNPTPARWKRPALFSLSLICGVAATVAGYTQQEFHWTNNGIWLVIVFLASFSVVGLLVSFKGNDFWVALTLGGF